jgi:hypothetical protein
VTGGWGWRRYGLIVIAVWLVALAVTFDAIADAANIDALLPELGAPLLLAGAVLLAVLACHPTSRTAYLLGGPLAIGGLVARPLIVALNWGNGFTRSGWSVIAAFLVYGALAAVGTWLQVWKVGPWVGRHKRGATAPGD